MKNQEQNTVSPKLTEQIIREFGIDPAEIPSWEELSLRQLYTVLIYHPSLTELYEAGANAERNRRMDVLDDLRAMWYYQADGGAPTPDELKHYGEAAWAAVDEIIQDADTDGHNILAFYARVENFTLDIPTGAEQWTPDNIRRATAILQIPLQHDWEGFSEVWDVMRFEILEGPAGYACPASGHAGNVNGTLEGTPTKHDGRDTGRHLTTTRQFRITTPRLLRE